MVKTIFYRTNEDALTHAFLATLDRLTSQTRMTFFQKLKIDALNELGEPEDIVSQQKLSNGKKPDGILTFSDRVVVFENKYKDTHYRGQLKQYCEKDLTDYDVSKMRFLLCADSTVQTLHEIEHELEEAGIMKRKILSDVVFWQDVFHVCSELGKENVASSLNINEVDRFLLKELRNLLKVMELGEKLYDGLKASDIKTYLDGRIQLKKLEKFLVKKVPQEFRMLESYHTTDSYSSLLKDRLGFNFTKAHGESRGDRYTYLFLRLKLDGRIAIGINSRYPQDLEKLKQNINIEPFLEEIVRLRDYSIWSKKEGGSWEEQPDILKARNLFNNRFQILRYIKFETLESEFELATPMFPKAILDEILRLRKIVELLDDAL